jgi:CobQ-like glutamine amidotransferase family enzyme
LNRRSAVVIVHLYPDLLLSYGDRGNVTTLAKRAEWRGFTVRVEDVTRSEPIPRDARLILIGGGSDSLQSAVATDLAGRRSEFEAALEEGAVVFAICGGYQLLGHRYIDPAGDALEGVGLLDIETFAGTERIVGRVTGQGSLHVVRFRVSGFENHAGRTFLGSKAVPLMSVPEGQGNNARDRTEGAVQGRVIGTYLHGPVLPSSPGLADALLSKALEPWTGGAPLEPLDDTLENAASESARSRRR